MDRNKQLQRHTPLRHKSDKRRRMEYKLIKPERDFLDFVGGNCPICGANGLVLHHMVAGPNRWRALKERAAWLGICNVCNTGDVEDETKWPLARQCALKFLQDPEFFDLATINRLLAPEGHPSPPYRITLTDVAQWLLMPFIEERPKWWERSDGSHDRD